MSEQIPIYEWPDGSFLSVLLREEGRDLLTGYVASFLPDVEIELQPETGVVYTYNNQIGNPPISASENQQKKILGWILDMGFQIYPLRMYSEISPGSGQKVQIGRYPRWIPDETWNLRYLSFSLNFWESATPFLGVIRGMVKEFQYSASFENDGIIVSWRTNSVGSSGSVYAELDETPESKERAVVKIVDQICSSELLLPESQREAWESAHSERGRFTQLSPEQIELYRLLGEPLPYLLPTEELREWLSARQE